MYIPIYVKIGHLEEIMIPVTAEAQVEHIELFQDNKKLERYCDVMPWKTSGDFPSYDKFLIAAYTYMKNVSSVLKQPSTLFKEV